MFARPALVAFVCLVGFALLVVGPNLLALWALWVLAVGILVGMFASKESSTIPAWLAGTLALLAVAWLTFRAMPVHSLGWNDIDGFDVTPVSGGWRIEVRDGPTLREMKEYVARGSYRTMVKSGTSYRICATAWDKDGSGSLRRYEGYVLGESIGREPGCVVQTVFVPAKPGFGRWFESLVAAHMRRR